MTILNLTSFASVPAQIARPPFDPKTLDIGVMHFGPGAFFRAHQVPVYEVLNQTDPRWGVCAVALHSDTVAKALGPQDGLYTLAILDAEIRYQVLGSLREVLFAPRDPEAVISRLADPNIRLVTATVTEKGYCLNGQGRLDFGHNDIVADLAHPKTPSSFIGYVVEGLRQRYVAGVAPFVLMSCDNQPDNGHKLKAAVIDLATASDPALGTWIATQLVCPGTMVDSITPATDQALKTRVSEVIGFEDHWPIQREAFTQWVMEAHDFPDGPDWAGAGVILTTDVAAFERAKLRLLNGAHSTLAYMGWLKGYETVAEAMTDQGLAETVETMMMKDIIPLLTAPQGLDLKAYATAILNRFKNPAIRHLLAQIAWDGSQKLPIRLISSLMEARARGGDLSRLSLGIAAWMRFVRHKAVRGETIVDPMAERLMALGQGLQDRVEDVQAFLSVNAIFPDAVRQNSVILRALTEAYEGLLVQQPKVVTDFVGA